VVYSDPASDYDGPLVVFSAPYPVGPWLGYGFDWPYRRVWIGPWHRGWNRSIDTRVGQPWLPNPNRPHAYSIAQSESIPRPQTAAPTVRTLSDSHLTRAPSAGRYSEPVIRGSGNDTFGGYERGSTARESSYRGQASRQAPERFEQSAPRESRSSGYEGTGGESHDMGGHGGGGGSGGGGGGHVGH
jgi:hypothetical protein